MARPATHREFFAVRTVAETLAGFRPARRTGIETVALAGAHGRVPAEPIRAPHDLPGFARATVDGFAVRAADTYGASEGLPSYLDVTGAVADGPRSRGRGRARDRRRDADRRRAPRRRGRGRDGRAHAGDDARHDRGRPPRRARRRASCAPTRTRAPAPSCCPPAARCARRTSACSRPRASTEVRVHARPRVAIVSTGDEVVPPGTEDLAIGQVRDATALGARRPRPRRRRRPRPARHRPRRPRRARGRPPRRGRLVRRRRRLGRLVGRRARRDRRRRRRAGRAGDLGPRDRAAARASRRSWPTAAACR